MFNKEDQRFDDMSADPIRRQQAIVALSSRRAILFWCAVGITLCSLASFLISGRNSGGVGAALGLVVTVLPWILVSKIDSDLKLLRGLERFSRDRDHATQAEQGAPGNAG